MKSSKCFFSYRTRTVSKLVSFVLLPLLATSFSPEAKAFSFVLPFVSDATKNVGKNTGKEAAEALSEGMQNMSIEAGFDDRDLDVAFEQTRGLVGYTTIQGQALMSHAGDEYRSSLSHSMAELTNYTQTLDQIAKERVDQVDGVSEARIKQLLEGINNETLLLSTEMTKQIQAIDKAVQSSSSHISHEVQTNIRTASDEMADLLGITTEQVSILLNQSEESLLVILATAGDEVAEVVRVTSEETQKNIRILGAESRELSVVTLSEFGEQTRASTREAANELRIVLDQVEGISRVLIADSAGHAIDITDNLSEETQEIIEVGAQNLEELSSHVTQDVLIINDALKESSIQVIEGGMYFIDRTADLVLAVGATSAGLVFLFVSSYGFTRGFLRWNLPDKYMQRVIVLSFMGSTVVASFAPFIFAIPSVRAKVLIPTAKAQEISEVIPPLGQRIPRAIPPAIETPEPLKLNSEEIDEATELFREMTGEIDKSHSQPRSLPAVANSNRTFTDERSAQTLKTLDINQNERSALNISNREIRELNRLTNAAFHKKHPELSGRTLGENDMDLMIEWRKMRKCKILADHLFYRAHPQRNRRPIGSNEPQLARKWKRIVVQLEGCS